MNMAHIPPRLYNKMANTNDREAPFQNNRSQLSNGRMHLSQTMDSNHFGQGSINSQSQGINTQLQTQGGGRNGIFNSLTGFSQNGNGPTTYNRGVG